MLYHQNDYYCYINILYNHFRAVKTAKIQNYAVNGTKTQPEHLIFIAPE
jgi:hypothetical protein